MRYFAPAFFAYGQFFTFELDVELDFFAFAAVFPRILTTLHCDNLKYALFTVECAKLLLKFVLKQPYYTWERSIKVNAFIGKFLNFLVDTP